MSRSPLQSIALLGGIALIALGILGFIPGVTSHEGDISFAGHGSAAKFIGVFQVSVLLNLLHILIGLAGVALARTAPGARQYLLGGGVACLVLWALGIGRAGTWIPLSAADDWLHLGIGVSLIGLAYATSSSLRTQ